MQDRITYKSIKNLNKIANILLAYCILPTMKDDQFIFQGSKNMLFLFNKHTIETPMILTKKETVEHGGKKVIYHKEYEWKGIPIFKYKSSKKNNRYDWS